MANYVVGQVMMNYRRGRNWKDNAVLYRMNAQSNALEYAFKRNGVPYKIIGGTKFFDRAEMKDMLAYLCCHQQPRRRPCGCGGSSTCPPGRSAPPPWTKPQVIATEESLPLMEVLRRAGDYPQLKAITGKLTTFTEMIDEMRRQADDMGLVEFYEYVWPPQRLCGDAPGEERYGEPGAAWKTWMSSAPASGLPGKRSGESHIVGLPGRGGPVYGPGQPGGRGQLRDADDHAQRQGTGVSQRVRGGHG